MKTSDFTPKKPVIVLGAGGHAKVLIEAIRHSSHEIIGITDPVLTKSSNYLGIKVLGDDDVVFDYSHSEVLLVNGIGAMPGNNLRRELNDRMENKGFQFIQIIHPSSIRASDIKIGEGVQIMAGAVIQPGVSIGRSCIINTGVIVDHDCVISDDCHLAPGVTLSGNVIIGKRTHIGTGTTIIQDISIGDDCVIAAGSIVHKDVLSNTKFIQTREERLEATV